jgi:hypothetical protein
MAALSVSAGLAAAALDERSAAGSNTRPWLLPLYCRYGARMDMRWKYDWWQSAASEGYGKGYGEGHEDTCSGALSMCSAVVGYVRCASRAD